MNTLQIILKNMRQRALSTSLTMLSVLLGVALAIGILILRREGQALFGQTDFGYELILGPPTGAPMTVTLNSVYHMDQSPGVINYALYEDLLRKPSDPQIAGRPAYGQYVKLAVPMVVGDSVSGRRVVGTTPQMFGVDDTGKPIADGVNDDGTPIVNHFEYRKGRRYELAQGRVFAPRKFEAVVGADVAQALKLHLYDPSKSEEENLSNGGAFRVTHGMPGPNDKPDVHKPHWHVVGILQPTGTANDRVLFVPFISLLAIAEHESGMAQQALQRAHLNLNNIPPNQREAAIRAAGIDPNALPASVRMTLGLTTPATTTVPAGGDLMTDAKPTSPTSEPAHEDEPDAYTLDADGNIVPNLPKDQWEVSAIFVKVRGGEFGGVNVMSLIQTFKTADSRATAVSPAAVMREFFDTFLKPNAQLLLAISALVTVVAGASIATTIYNSVSARLREIAILRALGATRGHILAIICTEAGLIGLVGGALGMLAGHGLALLSSGYFKQTIGEAINWYTIDRNEWFYLAAVVALSFAAGLVPAMKAYRTPVATNLVAS